MHTNTNIWVDIGSDNGLVPSGNKPFPEPMLTYMYHQRCSVRGINPLGANFLRGNISIYLHFVSFLHIGTTQVVKILPQISKEPTYST